MLFLLLTLAFMVGSLLVTVGYQYNTIHDQSIQLHDLRIQLCQANQEIAELLNGQPDVPSVYHRNLTEMMHRSTRQQDMN